LGIIPASEGMRHIQMIRCTELALASRSGAFQLEWRNWNAKSEQQLRAAMQQAK
jgi:hypothetical protein